MAIAFMPALGGDSLLYVVSPQLPFPKWAPGRPWHNHRLG